MPVTKYCPECDEEVEVEEEAAACPNCGGPLEEVEEGEEEGWGEE